MAGGVCNYHRMYFVYRPYVFAYVTQIKSTYLLTYLLTIYYLYFTCGSEACSSVFASNGGSLLPVCTVRVLQRHVLHLVIRGLQGQCGTVWYCSNKGSLVPVWSNCVTTLSPSLSVWPSSGLVRLQIVLCCTSITILFSS